MSILPDTRGEIHSVPIILGLEGKRPSLLCDWPRVTVLHPLPFLGEDICDARASPAIPVLLRGCPVQSTALPPAQGATSAPMRTAPGSLSIPCHNSAALFKAATLSRNLLFP